MHIRALALVALLTTPAGLAAQGIRIPRTGRGTGVGPVPGATPQPLPPEAPPVSRALEYKRSRWSTEGYSLVSSVEIPAASGGVTRYTTVGLGTHADYRYTDYFSATADLTASLPGEPVVAQTVEVGMRASPVAWAQRLRPFVDVRAAYMNMYDTFATPTQPSIPLDAANQQFVEGGRYSRGFGSVAGAGMEFSLTNAFALTTELSAMRNRMTTYRLTGPGTIPTGTSYWMTSFRYILGLRFNPVSVLHMVQKPTS